MVGVLFVRRPGVPAHHRIRFEQADQKDEPALELVFAKRPPCGDWSSEIVNAFQPQHPSDLGVVALIAKHVVADAARRAEPGPVEWGS